MSSERDDADRHVALRVLGLLRVGRDRVEADVGEEDDRRPGEHPDRVRRCVRLPATGLPKKLIAVQPYGANGSQLAGLT